MLASKQLTFSVRHTVCIVGLTVNATGSEVRQTDCWSL